MGLDVTLYKLIKEGTPTQGGSVRQRAISSFGEGEKILNCKKYAYSRPSGILYLDVEEIGYTCNCMDFSFYKEYDSDMDIFQKSIIEDILKNHVLKGLKEQMFTDYIWSLFEEGETFVSIG